MKIFFVLGVFTSLLMLPPSAAAQSSSRTGDLILLPHTIFVGDSGRLIVTLDQIFEGVEPFVLDTAEELPEITADLFIRRIELERRGSVSRLLIDFVPYVPGLIIFPPIELPSALTVPPVTGLELSVGSILNPTQMVLSDPAPPLVIPGTSLLIYGSIVLVLLILALGIVLSIWGRRNFRQILERFRRRHLLRLMLKFLRHLKQEENFKERESPGAYLSLLSSELREFLSHFTGFNCRPLSAVEFLSLPLDNKTPEISSNFLCQLFRTWDNLRFSGWVVTRKDLSMALDETERFIVALDRAEREKLFQKPSRELEEELCA